jgi:hypothetical protein
VQIDIDQRFRTELRDQELPARISLVGNRMLVAVARRLLAQHSPETVVDFVGDGVDEDTVLVALYSLESYGTAFLTAFLEEQEPPSMPALLYSIPESLILEYARRYDLLVVEEPKSEVRVMLDRIAALQPQTFYSLSKSALRLGPYAEVLRKTGAKQDKSVRTPMGS